MEANWLQARGVTTQTELKSLEKDHFPLTQQKHWENEQMSTQTTNTNNILWATAFFIAALIFVAAGRHSSRALADNVNTADGFTLLTTSNGQGTEYLHVIDNTNSMYMVYTISNPQNNKSINQVATWFLPAMFNAARN
jgi:hypothetical protein